MYKFKKNDYEMLFTKAGKGVTLRFSKGDLRRHFYVKESDLFTYENKWIALDCSSLEYDEKPENKIQEMCFNLVKVFPMYDLGGERIDLNYDESMLLEALVHHLWADAPWPLEESEEYVFEENRVTFIKDSKKYEYNMPTSEGLTKEDLMTREDEDEENEENEDEVNEDEENEDEDEEPTEVDEDE